MSTKQKKRRNLSRPFDPEVLRRAREIASEYAIIVTLEDGEYYGRGLELPGARDDGKTPDECVEKTREAMVAVVALMLERGETPPSAASSSAASRALQVNVRMTAQEKILIEEQARQKGFAGISEYIRAVALAK